MSLGLFFIINLIMFFLGGLVWHLINKMKDK
jgi:hypothetical protein